MLHRSIASYTVRNTIDCLILCMLLLDGLPCSAAPTQNHQRSCASDQSDVSMNLAVLHTHNSLVTSALPNHMVSGLVRRQSDDKIDDPGIPFWALSLAIVGGVVILGLLLGHCVQWWLHHTSWYMVSCNIDRPQSGNGLRSRTSAVQRQMKKIAWRPRLARTSSVSGPDKSDRQTVWMTDKGLAHGSDPVVRPISQVSPPDYTERDNQPLPEICLQSFRPPPPFHDTGDLSEQRSLSLNRGAHIATLTLSTDNALLSLSETEDYGDISDQRHYVLPPLKFDDLGHAEHIASQVRNCLRHHC